MTTTITGLRDDKGLAQGVVHILLRLHFKVGGWSIMLENCKLSTIKMQTFRWVGGQKSRKIANVICERSLT